MSSMDSHLDFLDKKDTASGYNAPFDEEQQTRSRWMTQQRGAAMMIMIPMTDEWEDGRGALALPASVRPAAPPTSHKNEEAVRRTASSIKKVLMNDRGEKHKRRRNYASAVSLAPQGGRRPNCHRHDQRVQLNRRHHLPPLSPPLLS